MLEFGIALLIGAAVLAPLTVILVRRWLSQRAFAAIRPTALTRLVGQQVTLTGTAVAGPAGETESRLARVDCVWQGHDVLRHYWQWADPDGSGERVRVRRCDSIAEYSSPEPFGIVGAGRAGRRETTPVLVMPQDADLNGVHMCLQRVVGRPQQGVPAPADDLLGRVKGRISGVFRGETIEFEYREWVLRSGDPIVVHGRVELRDGRPVIVAPPEGRVRIEHDAPRDVAPAPAAANALLVGGGAIASVGAGLMLTLIAG
ncbi:GIDE domain-containing protein [Salinactinospora qingdaonensis]|uniref:RING-type E3 ubiquitin transferase n=1 Tax=Salinactinospora qingdaonensis TaxID=702744 RepID=A0ABP7F7C4_9ACTN